MGPIPGSRRESAPTVGVAVGLFTFVRVSVVVAMVRVRGCAGEEEEKAETGKEE